MKRLAIKKYRSTDWMPRAEAEVTVSLPSSKRLGITRRSAGVSFQDFQNRGIRYAGRWNNGQGGVLSGSENFWCDIPSASDLRAAIPGRTIDQWTDQEAYNFGLSWRTGMISNQYGEAYGGDIPWKTDMNHSPSKYQKILEGHRDRALSASPNGTVIAGYGGTGEGYQTDLRVSGSYAPLDSGFVSALASPSAARGGQAAGWFGFNPLGTTSPSRYVCPVVQMYFFNLGHEQLYGRCYSMQRMQLACSDWASTSLPFGPVLFLWPKLIGPQNGMGIFSMFDIRYWYKHQLQNGVLWQPEGAFAAWNSVLGVCLSAFKWGLGVYSWEDAVLFDGSNPEKVGPRYGSEGADAGTWQPTVGGTPAPAPNPQPHFPQCPQGIYSVPVLAAAMYGQMAAVGGNNPRFVRFKVGGGAWIEPRSDKADILAAAAANGGQGRGWCEMSQNGNGFWVSYTNFNGPVAGELVTVDLGGGRFVSFDQYLDEPVNLALQNPPANGESNPTHFSRSAALAAADY